MLGTIIGSYRVYERLGAGGMGEVFLGEHITLGKKVALKKLAGGLLSTPGARERFHQEARAAARLTHPNIAATTDIIDTPEGPVIVMEYVPGETLAAKLAGGPLPVEHALEVAREIAAGLEAAHDEGIIHRDIKPANVQLTPRGLVKILDFGVAKSMTPRPADLASSTTHQQLTAAGHIVGTLGYMAPEQLTGGPADPRSDIYSLGIVLFEMLTGRRPFEAVDYLGTVLAVVSGPVPSVQDFNHSVPPRAAAIVARAMAREPKHRFSSAADLRHELSEVLTGLGSAVTRTDVHGGGHPGPPEAILPTPPAPAPVPAPPPNHWKRPTAWLAILLVTLAAGMILAPWWRGPDAHPEPIVGVLPFLNATGDAGNNYLALGMSYGLSNSLSSLSALRVLPPGDASAAAGAPATAAQFARNLGASFVVDGSMQRVGDALTVTMRLVGKDGAVRQGGTHQGNVSQLFELHRRLSQAVIEALSAESVIPSGAIARNDQPTSNTDAYADYLQGRAFLERRDVKGNLDHAIGLFTNAIQKDRRFALAHAALGDSYLAQYRETKVPDWTGKAAAAILEALRLDPQRAQVHMSMASLYRELGKTEQAVEELQTVMGLEPQNDDAHRELGDVYRRAGRFDEGIAEVTKARDLRPNYWVNHFELGRTYYMAGRLQDAAGAYLRVTQLQPDNARGYLNLGAMQHATGDIEQALVNYQKANSIEPRASAFSNIAVILHWRKEYAAAVANYEKAIALAPNEPQIYANLGDTLLQLGQRERARAQYRRAIDLVTTLLRVSGDDPENLAARATYEAKVGLRAAASRDIAKAVGLSKDSGQVLYSRAIIHALAGELAQSCAALTRALELGVSPVEARYADEFHPLKGCPAYDGIQSR